MTKEEKKQLEDAAKAAREKADQAHEAVAAASDEEADALQQAADIAEAEAQAAQEAFDNAVVAPEGEEDEEEEDIDFEKELAAIENGGTPPAPPATPPAKSRSELEKAERALHFNAKRFKELGGDPSKVLGAPPAPPPPPPADSSFATKEDLAEQEAAKYARTDAERKVIMHRYRTGIIKTGNVVEDIQNAYLLAHKGRIVRSFDEIRRGAAVRPMVATPPGRKPPAGPAKAPELSRADQGIMKSRGFVKNQDGSWESKRYKMTYDPAKKAFVTVKKSK